MKIYRTFAVVLCSFSLLLTSMNTIANSIRLAKADKRLELFVVENENGDEFVCLACAGTAEAFKNPKYGRISVKIDSGFPRVFPGYNNRKRFPLGPISNHLVSTYRGKHAKAMAARGWRVKITKPGYDKLEFDALKWNNLFLNEKELTDGTYYGITTGNEPKIHVLGTYNGIGNLGHLGSVALNDPIVTAILAPFIQSGAIHHLQFSNGALTPVVPVAAGPSSPHVLPVITVDNLLNAEVAKTLGKALTNPFVHDDQPPPHFQLAPPLVPPAAGFNSLLLGAAADLLSSGDESSIGSIDATPEEQEAILRSLEDWGSQKPAYDPNKRRRF